MERPNCLPVANVTSDTTDPAVVAIATIECALMVAILLLNGTIILAFSRSKKIRANITNFYLMQLAVADFILGLCVIMHVAFLLNPHVLCNDFGCLARFCSMMMVCGMSVLAHMAITYDRFIAIATPFQYRSRSNRKRVIVQALVINVVPVVIFVVIPMVWKDTISGTEYCTITAIFPRPFLAYITIPLYIVTIVVKVILYVTIFHVSRRRLDMFKDVHTSASMIWHRKSVHRTNVNLAKTGGMVLSIFIICWLPFFVLLMIQVYGGVESESLQWAHLGTFLLILLQSALNPVIYFLRIPAFQAEIYAMMFPAKARERASRKVALSAQGIRHAHRLEESRRQETLRSNLARETGSEAEKTISFETGPVRLAVKRPSAGDIFWQRWKVHTTESRDSRQIDIDGNHDYRQLPPTDKDGSVTSRRRKPGVSSTRLHTGRSPRRQLHPVHEANSENLPKNYTSNYGDARISYHSNASDLSRECSIISNGSDDVFTSSSHRHTSPILKYRFPWKRKFVLKNRMKCRRKSSRNTVNPVTKTLEMDSLVLTPVSQAAQSSAEESFTSNTRKYRGDATEATEMRSDSTRRQIAVQKPKWVLYI